MTDRKLLELAAKAAGIQFSELGSGARYAPQPGIMQPYVPWNPLADDSDALRLAVKLHLTVGVGLSGSTVTDAFRNPLAVNMHDNDPCAATRRAIVHAAAEIGRNMK